jgi:hypothetical protein
VFLAVVLLVWTGMHIYVFWRASSVPVIARYLPRGVRCSVPRILWTSYIGARIVSHFAPGRLARFLEVLGGYLVRLTHPSLAGRYEVNAMTVSCVAAPELADLACACGGGAR